MRLVGYLSFDTDPVSPRRINICYLRPGGPYRENCARDLEYGPRPQAEGRTQDRGHSFPYKDRPRQVNNTVCRSIFKGYKNARTFHWVRWKETVERM